MSMSFFTTSPALLISPPAGLDRLGEQAPRNALVEFFGGASYFGANAYLAEALPEFPGSWALRGALTTLAYKTAVVSGNAISCAVESLVGEGASFASLWKQSCEAKSDGYLRSTAYSVAGEALWRSFPVESSADWDSRYTQELGKSVVKVGLKVTLKSVAKDEFVLGSYLRAQVGDAASRVFSLMGQDLNTGSACVPPLIGAAAGTVAYYLW